MIKKVILSLLVTIMCFMNLNNVFAVEQETPESFDYTLIEVKNILDDYFSENGIDLQEGTKEYYSYLLEQLMHHSDKQLTKHPKYEIILDYASEYLVLYQKEQTKIEKANKIATLQDIDLSENLTKTIGEISNELTTTNKNNETIESNSIMPLAYSNYSPSKAVTYARKYAQSYNPSYKKFDSDCTNFVSQCLVAGGLKQVMKDPIPEYLILNTTTQWYHKNVYGAIFVSTSFIRVTDFFSYWKNKTGYVYYPSRSKCESEMKTGDVVLLARKSTGAKYHAIIISKGGTGGTYCGHTNPRKDAKFNTISSDVYFYRMRFA